MTKDRRMDIHDRASTFDSESHVDDVGAHGEGDNHGYVSISKHGADASGVGDSSAAFIDAIAEAAIVGGVVLAPPGTYLISGNVSVPTNVSIEFRDGALVSIDAGKTFAFADHSGWNAGAYRTFKGDGLVTFGASVRENYLPEWWGAIADGSTDSTSAVEAAAAAVPENSNIFFGPGTYRITSAIVISKAVNLIGAGRNVSILDLSEVAASSNYAFEIKGEITAINSALTGDAAISQADVDVVDGSLFTAGDWVRVRSEGEFNEQDETHLGELRVVEGVAGDTLTLTEDLADTYLTADTATVDKVTMLDGVEIRGLKVLGRGVGDGSHWFGLRISQATNVYVHDCWFTDCYSQSIILLDVVTFGVYNNTIKNSFRVGLGYGVAPANASRDGYVNSNNGTNCRHFFTTGANSTYGVVRNVVIDGNTLNATDLAARIGVLHTHNVSQFITFSDNTGWGTGLVTLNGLDVKVTNNRCFQNRDANPAILLTNTCKRIKLENNHIHVTVNTANIKAAVYIVRNVQDIELINNYIHTEHVGGTCIRIVNSQATRASTNITIKGNHLISDLHTGILVESVQEEISGLVISNNEIEAPNGAGINIKPDPTALKRPRDVHVHGNTIAAGGTGVNFQGVESFYVYNNVIKDATTGLAVLSPNASGLINETYRVHPNDFDNCTEDIADQVATEDSIKFWNVALQNETPKDAADSRESRIDFLGVRASGAEATLARIAGSHSLAVSDDTGQIEWGTNDGSDGENPTTRMRLDEVGLLDILFGLLKLTNTAGVDFADFVVDTDGYLKMTASGARIGLGLTPSKALDILGALRVTNTATVDFADLEVDANGYLKITASGGRVGFGMAPTEAVNILAASGPQLQLEQDAGVDYAAFEVDSDGNLNITPSGGIINLVGQSAARATMSADQNITANTWTKVEFDTEAYDAVGEYDHVTNFRFTATEDGSYLVTASVMFKVDSAGDNILMSVYVNGAESRTDAGKAVTTFRETRSKATVIKLVATDYVEIYVLNVANNDEIDSGLVFSFFEITKLH